MSAVEAAPSFRRRRGPTAPFEIYAALHEEAFAIRQKPWSPATFQAFAADDFVHWIEFWVEADASAEDGEADLAALALWRSVLDEAEILTLCRARRYAGCELGPSLLESVIAETRDAAVRSLILEVAEANRAARRLYADFEFSRVGFRRAYYRRADGLTDNALILRRSI